MSLVNLKNDWIQLRREVGAIMVPDGCNAVLPPGTEVEIVHELGGDFTLRSRNGRIYRMEGGDADALGRKTPARAIAPGAVSEGDLEDVIEERLRTCFDPEIPVNLVDLGLIYGTVVRPRGDGGNDVDIEMTLTAPGCGMGQVIVDDVTRKVRDIPGVDAVHVDLVFEPPWSPEMMSEAARLQAGLM